MFVCVYVCVYVYMSSYNNATTLFTLSIDSENLIYTQSIKHHYGGKHFRKVKMLCNTGAKRNVYHINWTADEANNLVIRQSYGLTRLTTGTLLIGYERWTPLIIPIYHALCPSVPPLSTSGELFSHAPSLPQTLMSYPVPALLSASAAVHQAIIDRSGRSGRSGRSTV